MAAVVIFDGVCNLCSRAVQFIVTHERAPTIGFASVQSVAGAHLLRQFGRDPQNAPTVVFVEGKTHAVRSDAAIQIARHLRWPWRVLGLIRFIPRPVRDRVYDAVARNRYRWFGRRESCMVPSPSISGRFLV